MIPPTLTPFPTVAPADNPIAMPHIALWDFAPKAVQVWSMAPISITTLIQAALLLVLVVAGIFMLISFLRGLTNEKDPAGDGE